MLGHRAKRGSTRFAGPMRRHGGQRGAVLIEFAIVAMVLVTLLAGAFDYGQAWRVGLAANEAARTGARVGSGQGDALTADFSLLSSMRSALDSSGEVDNVTRVVIFRSSTPEGRVPSTCVTGNGGSEPCNILTGDQFRAMPATAAAATDPTTGCVTSSLARGYCPVARDNVQVRAHYLGVWVQVRYDHLFPLLGSSLMVERTAVMRLEPKESS